jgi:hypothetical protein
VNAEVGTFSGYSSLSDTRGLAWSVVCGEEGKWGTYRVSLNENQLDHPGFWMTNPFMSGHAPGSAGNLGGPGLSNSTPINTWDLGGAWNVGDAMSVGLSVTRSSWSWEETAPNSKSSVSWTTIGGGFSWTNDENMVLDLVFNYGMAGGESSDDGPPATKLEYDSKNAFEVAGRLFYDWKDDVTVPIVADFISSDYSVKAEPTSLAPSVPNGDKMTAFKLGLGLDVDVNSDNTLIFAVEFTSKKWEYSNPDTTANNLAEISTTYMPTIRLALESHINSWLTTRIGAAKHVSKRTLKSNDGGEVKYTPEGDDDSGTIVIPGGLEYSDELSSFEWFLGAGFNVAEWTIDMELAHETPFSIGYWLTGYSAFFDSGPGPVARISAVYNY